MFLFVIALNLLFLGDTNRMIAEVDAYFDSIPQHLTLLFPALSYMLILVICNIWAASGLSVNYWISKIVVTLQFLTCYLSSLWSNLGQGAVFSPNVNDCVLLLIFNLNVPISCRVQCVSLV